MRISVVICTYNRAKYLNRTLNSLVLQGVKPYEIIVVDNNSTDNTKSIVAAYKKKLPIKYVVEISQGLSFARNTGKRVHKGDFLAYIDDDVILPVTWVKSINEAVKNIPSSVAIVGGRIEPKFDHIRPAWLSHNVLGYYGVQDLGRTKRNLKLNEIVFGAQMIFRSNVLKKYRFDVKLGYSKNNLLPGEETQLQLQMRMDGHESYYDPSIYLQHIVTSDTLTKKWLHKRAVMGGKVLAVYDQKFIWKCKDLLNCIYMYLKSYVPPKRFSEQINRLYCSSYFKQLLFGK